MKLDPMPQAMLATEEHEEAVLRVVAKATDIAALGLQPGSLLNRLTALKGVACSSMPSCAAITVHSVTREPEPMPLSTVIALCSRQLMQEGVHVPPCLSEATSMSQVSQGLRVAGVPPIGVCGFILQAITTAP